VAATIGPYCSDSFWESSYRLGIVSKEDHTWLQKIEIHSGDPLQNDSTTKRTRPGLGSLLSSFYKR
jgi:hypothetical protein